MSERSQTFADGTPKLDKNFILKIISNYDELITNLNEHVEFYKNEHQEIRDEICKVLEENEKLGSEIKLISSQSENSQSISTENYKKLSNCIIKNLQDQILNLSNEKKSIEECWKVSEQTIANLDKALREFNSQYPQSPSIHEIKKEYTIAIELLETNLKEAKEKLGEQLAINRKLIQLKNKQKTEFDALCEKYKKLEDEQKSSIESLEKTEALFAETKEKLHKMMKRNCEIEKYLHKASTNNREKGLRETEAISKVEDAVRVAETALKEKDEAILREKDVKEECDFLTTTLNHVMDDATKKLEDEVREVRKEYDLKIKSICSTVEKLTVSLNTQTERANAAENKIKHLENELKTAKAINKRLDSDLHVASQTIIEMELKVEAFEKLMETEVATNKFCEEKVGELQTYLKKNRKLKEQWKLTVEDITNKLQTEIQQLQNENLALKNENTNLKLSRNNIGVK